MEWASLFIDPEIIIQFTDSLLESVFQTAEVIRLQIWSEEVITGVGDVAVEPVIDQLGYDPRN